MVDPDNDNPDTNDEELERLTQELYTRKEPERIKRRREVLHRLGLRRHERVQEDADLSSAQFKNLALQRARRFVRRLRVTSIVVAILAVIVWAVVATMWYRRTQEVTQDDIAVAVSAPAEFTAGEEITYTVTYRNDSKIDWQNVELTLEVPKGFRFIRSSIDPDIMGRQYVYRIGDVDSEAEGSLTLDGQLIGEQDETAVVRAELLVTPSNFPSGRFSNVAVFSTTITALPLEVSVDVPGDAASGERVLVGLDVRNLSSRRLDNIYLRVRAAPGVQFAVEDTAFSPGFSTLDSEWLLPPLESLESAARTLVLYPEGQPGERRMLEVEAGVRQGEDEFTQRLLSPVITLSASELLVEQLYNGSSDPITVRPGDLVEGMVRYQNLGTVGLRDAIVEISFEGIGIDLGTLAHQGGAYDPRERKIVWSAATIPDLAVVQPQQSGEIPFRFRMLPVDGFPTEGDEAKNHVLVSTATVDSPDLSTPVGQPQRVVSDRAVISVRTALTLQADAFYDDGRLGITSSGPAPPVVGETTTYTLRFRLGSDLNDVGAVRMLGVVPDGVRTTGALYTTAGEVTINDRSGEIVWSLPFLEGLTGRTRPPEELHVQVAITPGENTRGQAISFLNKLEADGIDQFTEERVEVSGGQLPSTATALTGGGDVQ